MKKIYATVCSILVTALIGFGVWIKGFIDGYRASKSNYEPLRETAETLVEAADKIKSNANEMKADFLKKSEEKKGYSTIRSVDDLEDDESDD